MILEHVELNILPGMESSFEETFEQARKIISPVPGFVSLRLERCLESPSRYLLLVEWETLENHTEGFRGSPQSKEWSARLQPLYGQPPVVQHYEGLLRI